MAGLLTLARRRGLAVTTLDLRNSGDTAGDRRRVVGYGAWLFSEPGAGAGAGEDEDAGEADVRALEGVIARHGRTMLDLARASIRHGLDAGTALPIGAGAYPGPLAEQGASFVTLRHDGRLRGCIGSSRAVRPLAEDIADNAFAAAFEDHPLPEARPAGGRRTRHLGVAAGPAAADRLRRRGRPRPPAPAGKRRPDHRRRQPPGAVPAPGLGDDPRRPRLPHPAQAQGRDLSTTLRRRTCGPGDSSPPRPARRWRARRRADQARRWIPPSTAGTRPGLADKNEPNHSARAEEIPDAVHSRTTTTCR